VAAIARSAKTVAAAEGEAPGIRGYACDATDPAAVTATFDRIAADLGAVDVLAYNAGSGVWGTFDAVDPERFEASWRVNVLGLLLCARAVTPEMRRRGSGAIAVVGAGAAWRGRAGTAAFAQAKAAQRSLAQSMARQLGPEGVHVCYAVIDAAVGTPAAGEPDSAAKPDDIASAIWDVVHQPRSAWTFEFDLRPFREGW
jgi:NAD(P)-dependent dehydrogenase (short-subunit alcohol dehydrogenase family)